MSDHRISEDAGHAFRFVVAGIAMIVVVGFIVLVLVVTFYRTPSGRHIPATTSTPAAPVPSQSPS